MDGLPNSEVMQLNFDGCMGCFPYMFGWLARKLFPSKSKHSEGSSKGREKIPSLKLPQLYLEPNVNGDVSAVRGSGRCSSATNRSSSFSESSKKPKQVNSVNQTRSHDRSKKDLPLFKAPMDTKRSHSRHSSIKGNASSSAFQAKDKSQRKDGPTLSKILVKKELKQKKLKQSSKSHPSTQKTGPIRTSVNKSANVLRLNGEEQNGVSNKDKSAPKISAAGRQIQHLRKAPPVDAPHGPSKTSQRKDGPTSSNAKILVKKELKHEKLKQSCNSHPSTQKTGPIRSSVNKSANVLRLNSEKQIRVSNKDRLTNCSRDFICG